MMIGSESVSQKTYKNYIKDIDINLFEIQNNVVRFGRYLIDKVTGQANTTNPGKRLPTLGDFNEIDKPNKLFFDSDSGKLVSRAEIIRIFIKSLYSALQSAWDLANE